MLSSPRSTSGFTMIEFIVAMSLSVLLMGATGVVLGRTSDSMVQTRSRDAANTLGFSVLERSRAYGCGTLVGATTPNPARTADPSAPATIEEAIRENCARSLLDNAEAEDAAGRANFGSYPDGTGCVVGSTGDAQRCYEIDLSYTWQPVDVSGFEPDPDAARAPGPSPARMLVRRVVVEHRSLDYPVELESVQSFGPDFERFAAGLGNASLEVPLPPERTAAPGDPAFEEVLPVVELTSVTGEPEVRVRVQSDSAGRVLFPYLAPGEYTYEVFSDMQEPFGELDEAPSGTSDTVEVVGDPS